MYDWQKPALVVEYGLLERNTYMQGCQKWAFSRHIETNSVMSSHRERSTQRFYFIYCSEICPLTVIHFIHEPLSLLISQYKGKRAVLSLSTMIYFQMLQHKQGKIRVFLLFLLTFTSCYSWLFLYHMIFILSKLNIWKSRFFWKINGIMRIWDSSFCKGSHKIWFPSKINPSFI